MLQNIYALDTVKAKPDSAKAIIELLISNYDGTVNDGNFKIKEGTVHETHAALSDLLSVAKKAASTISCSKQQLIWAARPVDCGHNSIAIVNVRQNLL